MTGAVAGKRLAVAGATSALGRAIAGLLAAQGARLLLLGRKPEPLGALAASLASPSNHVIGCVDVETDPNGIIQPVLQEAERDGAFDGGVYCPGVAPLLPLRALKTGDIERTFRVNFVGAQMFAKGLASKPVRSESGGSIVFIASIAGSRGDKGISTYCASKAALISSAQSLAIELAGLRIRVNCVSPGWFESPMADASFSWYPGGRQEVEKRHPLGLGAPEDVAGAVAFLLSDGARWITGANLVVDGGFLA